MRRKKSLKSSFNIVLSISLPGNVNANVSNQAGLHIQLSQVPYPLLSLIEIMGNLAETYKDLFGFLGIYFYIFF